MKTRSLRRHSPLITPMDRISAYLMAAPTIILFLMFCIYPAVHVFVVSFYKYDGITSMIWKGLENYERVFLDASWWKTVWNTVQMGVCIPMLQIPLALLFAVILNGKLKGKNFFRTMLFLPSITSTAVMGVIFSFMFSSYNGIVNGFLINSGMIDRPIEWLGNEWTAKLVIILFSAWSSVGFYMVLFLSGLQKIPGEVYESAAVDGANTTQTFFKITVPMLGSMFRTVVMLAILNAMKLFDSVKVLTGGGPGKKTEVMTMYIYRYFFEPTSGKPQRGYASALSIVGLCVISIVAFLYMLASKKSVEAEQ